MPLRVRQALRSAVEVKMRWSDIPLNMLQMLGEQSIVDPARSGRLEEQREKSVCMGFWSSG